MLTPYSTLIKYQPEPEHTKKLTNNAPDITGLTVPKLKQTGKIKHPGIGPGLAAVKKNKIRNSATMSLHHHLHTSHTLEHSGHRDS